MTKITESESKGETQVYELGYLLLPSVAEDKLDAVVAKLRQAVKAAGGEELDAEAPEYLELAYTMSKTVGASRYVVNDAYIGWLKFEVSPEAVNQIKAAIEGVEEVLRSLLVKAPRETSFTFAKAKALLAEHAAKEQEKEGEKSEGTPLEGALVQ